MTDRPRTGENEREMDLKSAVLPRRSRVRRHAQMAFGYVFAAVCLAWVLYHVHPRRLLHDIGHLRWELVLLAIAVDSLNYVFQGIRWSLLLQPLTRVRVRHTVQGIYVGLFANEVLPMRFGEIVRGYLVSRWYSRKFSAVIPSMIVERLFEGVWLALGIGLATMILPLPEYLLRGAQFFGAVIVIITIVFLYAVFREEKSLEHGDTERLDQKLPPRIGHFIEQVASGLKRIGLSTPFYLALAMTFAVLVMQALSYWLVIAAYGLRLMFWQAAVVLVVVRLGIAIPNAPANLGTHQFFTALGLELFGIERSVATGFSFVLFVVLSGPLWLIGFFALTRSGTTLFRLRREIGAR